jgi:hypothetical protein
MSVGTALVQAFRQRQVEFLLRLFRYKKRNSEQWRDLHAKYLSAQAQGLATVGVPRSVVDDRSAPEPTLEQMFIQILLLGAMNTGQFSPRELLWAIAWIARWRGLLTLRSADDHGATPGESCGFVVDLRGSEGLRRPSAGEAGDFLHLDTAPLMGAIDRELAALADAPAAWRLPQATEADVQTILLTKLRLLLAPVPLHVKRRGERNPVVHSVHAISGLTHIVQMLREDTQRRTAQLSASASQLEDVTIAPTRGHTRMLVPVAGAADFGSYSIAATLGARPQTWQVKDYSDSGCRVRGQTSDLNGLIPGSLIALRENETAQWTVAVIRRLRRLMVDHVEISMEHIGRKPRFVKIVTDVHRAPIAADAPAGRPRCYGALYLPASEQHPTMPIKTLLVPAKAFKPGAAITLLSSTATFTLRLNEPLEQQSDFVWTSFAVIDRTAAKPQATRSAVALAQ